jgi:V8-like Glu-specific endopeptidase
MRTVTTRLTLAAGTLFTLISAGLLTAQSHAGASSSHTTHLESAAAFSVESFWTPERLRSAQPRDLAPAVSRFDGLPATASEYAAKSDAPSVKVSGAPPTLKASPELRKVLIPSTAESEKASSLEEGSNGITPEATSTFGAYFTTSRVFPDAATTAYPYSTAGKLFFHEVDLSGNDLGYWVCSASVLRPRIIVTAGHCVTHPSSDPNKRYFFRDFLFVPAYNNGVAPFGSWTAAWEVVANAWYFADEDPFVVNAQDVAMLVANDQNGTKLGYRTGWLGYWTNRLDNNHVTMLGYPCNLDSCQRMEETFAQEYQYGGNNTYIYGSAMRGGASGGPWIQDFGVAPEGAEAGLLGNNYLVAVTSYGPIATDPKYLGASNLGQGFLDVLSLACGADSTGNCN